VPPEVNAAIEALASASIGGNFIRPEAGQRVHWTKVSTNTKVRVGHIVKRAGCTVSHVPMKPGIANTIVRLHNRASA
jgi:hypothetical protein